VHVTTPRSESASDRGEKVHHVPGGFLDVFESAETEGVGRVANALVAPDHDDLEARVDLVKPAEQLRSSSFCQWQGHEDELRAVRREPTKALRRRAMDLDVVRASRKARAHELE
jgi:hypothetical protein